jgi:hypothetical protein
MEKELTAVEWFFAKAKTLIQEDSNEFEDLFMYYYQAKQMERNANLKIYVKGINDYKNNFEK